MSLTPEPDPPDPAPYQPSSRPTPPLTIHNTNEMNGSTQMTTHPTDSSSAPTPTAARRSYSRA